MTTVFADTGFYVALLNPRESYSQRALQFASNYRGGYLTTTLALTEVANFVSASRWRQQASGLIEDLVASDEVEIVHADEILWLQALRLYAERLDKQWSHTDCLSFLVMSDHQVHQAAATDHHFLQAGFEILL